MSKMTPTIVYLFSFFYFKHHWNTFNTNMNNKNILKYNTYVIDLVYESENIEADCVDADCYNVELIGVELIDAELFDTDHVEAKCWSQVLKPSVLQLSMLNPSMKLSILQPSRVLQLIVAAEHVAAEH